MDNNALELFNDIRRLSDETENYPAVQAAFEGQLKDLQIKLDSKSYERSLKSKDYDNRRIRFPIYACVSLALIIIGLTTASSYRAALILIGVGFLIPTIKNLIQFIAVKKDTAKYNHDAKDRIENEIETIRKEIEDLDKTYKANVSEKDLKHKLFAEEYKKLLSSAAAGEPDACYEAALINAGIGKREEATTLMEKAALGGHMEAQKGLARYLESVEDFEGAAKWYKEAADKGDGQSQLALFNLWTRDQGVSFDKETADGLLRSAAAKGVAGAQYQLGMKLRFGIGTSENDQEALIWLEKAALQNTPPAQYIAGVMYYNGIGTVKDIKKGVEYVKAAADNAVPNAQSMLAVIYMIGSGPIEADKTKAYYYCEKVLNNTHNWLLTDKKEDNIPVINYIYGNGLVNDVFKKFTSSDGSYLYKSSIIIDPDYKKGMELLRTASNQGEEKADKAIRTYDGLLNS